MTIEEILALLKNAQNRVGVRVFFTQKNFRNGYRSYSPILDAGLTDKLIAIIIDSLEEKKEWPVCDFSPVGGYSDMLEQYQTGKIMFLWSVFFPWRISMPREQRRRCAEWRQQIGLFTLKSSRKTV